MGLIALYPYVSKDKTSMSSPSHSFFSLGSSTSPNFCPTRTFCPACTANSKVDGASNTSTIVLPRQNPPISCPGLNGWPFRIGDAAEYTASVYVPGGGGRPRTFVRKACFHEPVSDCHEEGKANHRAHLIEVYFNAAHVRRAYGNHAEKPVPPAPEHSDTFVQHKQILHALCHIGRYRKQFTCFSGVSTGP
jgi:hypothetical protein